MASLDDVLAALREHISETDRPVATTPEVAGRLDQSRRKTLDDLKVLERADDVESHTVGARATIWWPSSRAPVETVDERRRLTSTATQEPRMDENPASGSGDEPVEPQGETRESTEDDLPERVRTYIEEQDLPPKTNHGRDAVMDVFRELREHGERSTGDLQDAVYPSYTDHWGAARGMWQSINRYLERIPGVEKPDYGVWGYEGDDVVRRELDRER